MAKPALNQNLYNYTYLTANGYLDKFRTALERPDLDRALLTKLLQTFNHDYKLVRFIVPDTKGNMALYYKDTLNNILGIDRTGFQVTKPKSNPYLNILKNYLDKWDYEDYAKEDYQTDNNDYIDMPDADMETVSRSLISYQNVNESSFKNLLSENEGSKLLSNQWFDDVDDFENGFAMVKLNGQLRNIDTNGNIITENKKNMGKNIYITESQYERLIQEGGEKKYAVEPNKVKIVVKFLDDNFLKAGIPTLGEDGYPKTVPIVVLKGTDGQPVKKMTDAQLYELLKDKFGKMYSDTERVNKFLKQIIKDWYYGKVSKEGLLTVNLY